MKAQIRKAAAPMTIIARYFIKSTKAVVYRVRPSKAGEAPYCTTVINGRATGCTCKARSTFKQHVACKHMVNCEALELARVSTVGNTYTQSVAQVVEKALVGANHEVKVTDFYAQRGAEMAKKIDAAQLNGRNAGFSLLAKSL